MTLFLCRRLKVMSIAILYSLASCIFEPAEEDPLGRRIDDLKPLVLIHESFNSPPLQFRTDSVVSKAVINNQDAWADIWNRLYPVQSTRPPLPAVDFQVNTVIALVIIDRAPPPSLELDSLVVHEKGARAYGVIIESTIPIGITVPVPRTSLILVPKVEVTDWRFRRA